MLHEILRMLATAGTYPLPQLARRLGVSEELLQTMMEELVRMGYLRAVNTHCGDGCGYCPEAGACSVSGGGRVWMLTAAGRRLAQR